MVPMIPQQFYQMAQHHAAVNAAFPIPASVAYMSLPDAEVYSSVPSSTYSVPQHVVHSDVYAPDSSAANALYWPQSYDPYPRSYCAYPIDGIDSFRQETASSSSGVYNKETLSRPNVAAPEASHLTTIMLPTPRDTSANSVVNAESSSEMLSDAPIADEHKWRKYGQKQVKRSPYPRNYYKCTVSGCPAKKHLEKFWDPTLNRERCRTVFLGEHVHPVAVSPQVFASTQADFQSNVLAQSAKVRPRCNRNHVFVGSFDFFSRLFLLLASPPAPSPLTDLFPSLSAFYWILCACLAIARPLFALVAIRTNFLFGVVLADSRVPL